MIRLDIVSQLMVMVKGVSGKCSVAVMLLNTGYNPPLHTEEEEQRWAVLDVPIFCY